MLVIHTVTKYDGKNKIYTGGDCAVGEGIQASFFLQSFLCNSTEINAIAWLQLRTAFGMAF